MKINSFLALLASGMMVCHVAAASTCPVGNFPGTGPNAINAENAAAKCPEICRASGMVYVPSDGWINNGTFSACPCFCGP